MCWSFNFAFPGSKKRKGASSPTEKKRRDSPTDHVLHGEGRPVVADVSEKRRSKESTRKRRSGETVSSRSSRHDREERRPRSQHYHEDSYQRHDYHRPTLNVQVPDRYHRPIVPEESNSSQEALLNPRPHRSQHSRRRHPKRTSQTTLRGRGAKRDPPRHSKSKKNLRPEPSRGWSFFAPSPPRTPKRDHRTYQALDSPPRSQYSSRQRRSPQTTLTPDSLSTLPRHHHSRQHDRSTTSSRQTRSRTPNTTARRVPDRRFAVLAATNQALEDVRREAFAQPSPPPRRERLRRYEGVTIPTSTIPFNWDCVSSSQASAPYTQTSGGYAYAESSSRQRRSRR